MEITGNISVSVLQFVLLQDVGADTLFSFPFSAYFPRVKEEPDLAKEKPAEQTKVWLLPIEKINSLEYKTMMANCKGCTNNCRLTINKFSGGRQFISALQ